MTVEELIKALEGFDPETEVRISQPTHNYWREIQAQTIDYVDEAVVGYDEMIYDSTTDATNNADGYNVFIVIRG